MKSKVYVVLDRAENTLSSDIQLVAVAENVARNDVMKLKTVENGQNFPYNLLESYQLHLSTGMGSDLWAKYSFVRVFIEGIYKAVKYKHSAILKKADQILK